MLILWLVKGRPMSRRLPPVALGVLLLLPLSAPAADEEPAPTLKPWDAAEVERLAREVQHLCSTLRHEQRQRPPASVASGQEHSRVRYVDLLFQIEGESRRMADLAAAGKSRDDLLNTFRTTDGLQRDVAEQARRLFLAKKTIDELQTMRADIEELRLFFQGTVDTSRQLAGPKRKKGGE